MNLANKKVLASRALHVGKNKIVFNPEGLNEIKEAITKQDIMNLFNEGIISIKPKSGRKKIKKRTTKKGPGKIKLKVKHRKRDYVKITRKLRKIILTLKNNKTISKELYRDLRKKIKMRFFKSRQNLNDYLKNQKLHSTENKELKIIEDSFKFSKQNKKTTKKNSPKKQ
jgi:large subunit ribosomal protein L19e